MPKKKKTKTAQNIRSAAMKLIREAGFFYLFLQTIAELGIVGEKRNSLVLFLAGMTKVFDKPVSVLQKGASSTGKSELVKAAISLFPPESVLKRASLSGKAPVHGTDELAGRILYIVEYRGAKDALYLTRLLQSEGEVIHEYASVLGSDRGTVIASRKGSPVVMTTTTAELVFEDDETRFLSIQADDSSKQTRKVIAAHFNPTHASHNCPAQPVWHEAIRQLCRKVPSFRYPRWFSALASEIPADEPRARRDAVRFLTLLKIVALCRSQSDGRFKKGVRELEVCFADYCVAYHILARAFTATFSGVHPQVIKLAKSVRKLHKRLGRSVSVKELAAHLEWSPAVVYKFAKKADKQKLVQYDGASRMWNQKGLFPGLILRPSFLPDPQSILNRSGLDAAVRYVHPLTGREVVLRPQPSERNEMDEEA